MYFPDFWNSLRTLEIITETELSPLEDDNSLVDLNTDNIIDIQDLFEPKFVIIFTLGIPVLVRYYPIVEIAEAGTEGIASFVIYVDQFYKVERQDNLLRLIHPRNVPADDWSIEWSDTAFMEIKQVPNITIEEMEQKIISYINSNRYYSTFHHQPSEEKDIPYVTFSLADGFEWDSIITSIQIKDNENGGVFVITSQSTLAALENLNSRFRSFIKTLEVLDLENATSTN